jgi:hypothetical protein
LQRVLAPAVRECDKHVVSVSVAQSRLTGHIDRLSHELEILVAAMPAPAAATHRGRISAIQGRIARVSKRVKDVHDRMNLLKTEAFGMRRANLVRVAETPLDELPANQHDMYRANQIGDDDEEDEGTRIGSAEEPLAALPDAE